MATEAKILKTVTLANHKIAFLPVPKVASTTVKMLMYAIDFGKPFSKTKEDGSKNWIHTDYQGTRRFVNLGNFDYSDFHRVAVVRDPVERIISAYIHRVKKLKCLSASVINMDLAQALGVDPDPPLHKFVRNLEKYRILSSEVKHHTDRFTEFLGPDMGFYSHVFKLDQLADLTQFFVKETGVEAVLPRSPHQTSKAKINFGTLGFQGRASLLAYCAGDYALLRGYYSDEKYRDRMYPMQD